MIITDEAHHAAARSYQKIYIICPASTSRIHATPIEMGQGWTMYIRYYFDRDLKWGIQRGYLSDIIV